MDPEAMITKQQTLPRRSNTIVQCYGGVLLHSTVVLEVLLSSTRRFANPTRSKNFAAPHRPEIKLAWDE